jgi:soluble P-type ATPase
MIEINIPGRANLNLEHLVMDVNGTIAVDGVLIDGVLDRINSLHGMLTIHLLTANTHGGQDQIDAALNLRSIRIKQGYEKEQKADYVERLGKEKVVAIGQGMNDAWMLRAAELGICVLSPEGTARSAMEAADLFLPDIITALDLFKNPLRLIASLRQ